MRKQGRLLKPNNMKTIKLNDKTYMGIQTQGMPDVVFKSMLLRNSMTGNAVSALKQTLVRGGWIKEGK